MRGERRVSGTRACAARAAPRARGEAGRTFSFFWAARMGPFVLWGGWQKPTTTTTTPTNIPQPPFPKGRGRLRSSQTAPYSRRMLEPILSLSPQQGGKRAAFAVRSLRVSPWRPASS